MIYAEARDGQGYDSVQAFDSVADLRAAESDGWQLTRLTRREVEAIFGRKFQVGELDSEGCGYSVHYSH